MAIINFYDDILSDAKTTREVSELKSLREYIEDYLSESDNYEVQETFNLETGETEYKTIFLDNYKVISLVNNEEKELDYVITENDIIQIVFIPQRIHDTGLVDFINGAGGVLAVIGGFVGLFNFGAGLLITAVGAGLLVWGGVNAQLNEKETGETKTLETEQALTMGGGNNQSLVGNRYPFIMGKHLINPYIAGSSYNTTHTKDMTGKDNGQYLSCLYCVGYAPLRITDIKIGEVWAAYNRSSGKIDSGDYTSRKTVMHGKLKQYINAELDDGEILRKWKNNDLSFEILQKGKLALQGNKTKKEQVADMYGTIYPQKVAQLDVDANLINIKDGLVSDVATKVYKGVSVANGFASNSVRLSESCPNRLEVEIDFPNGLYAQRSHNSSVNYFDLPVRLAVQWRYVRDGQNSSDANDPIGWNNFDYILTDEEDCKEKNVPKVYTLAKKMYDYNSELGKTEWFDSADPDSLNDFIYSDNWLRAGTKLFEFGCESQPSEIADETFYTKNSYSTSEFPNESKFKQTKYYTDEKCENEFTLTDNHEFKCFAKTYSFGYTYEPLGSRSQWRRTGYVNSMTIQIDSHTYSSFLTDYPYGTQSDDDFLCYDINGKSKRDYIPSNLYLPQLDRNDSEMFGIMNVHRCLYLKGDPAPITLYRKINEALDGSETFTRPYGYVTYDFDTDEYCEEEIGRWNESSRGWIPISQAEYDEFIKKNSTGKCANLNPTSSKYNGISVTIDNGDGTESVASICMVKMLSTAIYSAVTSLEEELNKITYKKSITGSAMNPTTFEAKSGVHERRFVVVKDFTEEECRQMVNFDVKEKVSLDSIEVRVLRITPTYLAQTESDDEDYSAMTYQDLAKWTTLRSFCFNKDEYKEALETAKKNGTLDSVKVEDYPQRPQSEEDMDKFCYLAVNLKQDVAETGGSSLNEVSCIATSLAPKHLEELESEDNEFGWTPNPNDLKRTYKYFRIDTGDDGESIYTEITKTQYNSASDKTNYIKRPSGNNYLDLIKAEIFDDTNNPPQTEYKQAEWNNDDKDNDEEKTVQEPFPKYFLSNGIENRYVTNNTASVFALSLIGKYLGKDAKTFDDINMYALTQAYDFCEDITDGTPDEESEDGLKHFKFACNGVVSSEVKLESLCEKILVTGRCGLKRDDENKYEVVIAREQHYPIMLLNQQNCLSKSNARSFTDIPSGIQINFVDEDDNYGNNDVYIMDDGEDYKNPTKEIESYSFQYVTNRNQIWSLGRFNLGCRIYQRETYTRTVGKVGYLLSYGDMVLLQDETLLVGTDRGARIKEIIYNDNNDINGKNHKIIYGFITDEPFHSTGIRRNGKNPQGITIMQSGKLGRSRCVTLRLAVAGSMYENDSGKFVMNKGITNVLILDAPIAIEEGFVDEEENVFVSFNPKINDIVAFGEVSNITTKAIINSIKPSDGEKFELALVPYDEKLYQLGKKMIEFKSRMTQPVRESTKIDFVEYVTQEDVQKTVTAKTGKLEESLKEVTQNFENSSQTPTIITIPTSIGIAVNDESILTKTQTFTIKVAVNQFNDSLSFNFEEGGFTVNGTALTGDADSNIRYELGDKEIKITIKKGTKITASDFKFPITYRPLLQSDVYTANKVKQQEIDEILASIVDEEEREAKRLELGSTLYGIQINGEDEPQYYGFRKYSDETVREEINVNAIPVEGGKYLGYVIRVTKDYIYLAENEKKVDSEGNPYYEFNESGASVKVEHLVMGDYMTYVGEDGFESPYVAVNGNKGTENYGHYFYKSRQYEFIGESEDSTDEIMWEWSSMSEHIGGDISDALAVANESLKMNNSQVVQFLDHLTANSIFVDKLVANSAFIKKLTTNKLYVTNQLNPGGNGEVEKFQEIYYLSASITTPDAPAQWVSNQTDFNNKWATAIGSVNGLFKYIFTCNQYKFKDEDIIFCSNVERNQSIEQSLDAQDTAGKALQNAEESAKTALEYIKRVYYKAARQQDAPTTAILKTIDYMWQIEGMDDANKNGDYVIYKTDNANQWSSREFKRETDYPWVWYADIGFSHNKTCVGMVTRTPVLLDEVLVSGGKIYANLIDVNSLLAQDVSITEGGLIHSATYNGELYNNEGSRSDKFEGWAIRADGLAEFNGLHTVGMYAEDGIFNNVEITEKSIIKGYIRQGVTSFNLMTLGFRYTDGKIVVGLSSFSVYEDFVPLYDDNGNENTNPTLTIKRQSTGIYRVSIDANFLKNNFPAVFNDDDDWRYLTLTPSVRWASDAVDSGTLTSVNGETHKVTYARPWNPVHCNVIRPIDFEGYLDKDSNGNADSFSADSPHAWTGIVPLSIIQSDGSKKDLYKSSEIYGGNVVLNKTTNRYDFMLVISDNSSDSLQDLNGGISLLLTANYIPLKHEAKYQHLISITCACNYEEDSEVEPGSGCDPDTTIYHNWFNSLSVTATSTDTDSRFKLVSISYNRGFYDETFQIGRTLDSNSDNITIDKTALGFASDEEYDLSSYIEFIYTFEYYTKVSSTPTLVKTIKISHRYYRTGRYSSYL